MVLLEQVYFKLNLSVKRVILQNQFRQLIRNSPVYPLNNRLGY